ncbi:hypothetical protein VTK26DRAFT_3927 [Humicola hyalothermophila]
MRLFLIRHGETVDNVAGIYAGTRDSPLTTHGALQARRLAAHLARHAPPITHVFSSDLRRAVETARAIVAAQPPLPSSSSSSSSSASAATGPAATGDVAPRPRRLDLVQLPELRERDFGEAEGRKFGAVPSSLRDAGAESHEAMRVRAEGFVQRQLVPLLHGPGQGQGRDGQAVVAVVAHGLILDVLLRVLLAKYGPAELARLGRAGSRHLVGWSNTGYVEAVVCVRPGKGGDTFAAEPEAAEASGDRMSQQPAQPDSVTLSVVGVNVLRHLEGLKKTRGGIGSAQFDKRQRTVDSFFGPASKKLKVKDSAESEAMPLVTLSGGDAA